MAVRAAALLALLGLVALVAAQGGNPATVGFATPPGFGTGEVNGWLNISPGQVLAVPISMVAGTSIRLSNFNMYVRHPNKADLNGAFWYGLYADVSGVPGGACLAPLRDTVLPYADGPDSRIVNDAINATFQTIAWTGNPVVFTAGARYWLCMASSLTLGIFANFAGTTPIMLAAADMSNPYPDLTGRTFPYFSVPNGGLTAASVDLFLTVLSNAPTLATGATSTATTATVAATVAGPATVAATAAGPVTVAATTATVAGPATVATVGTTGAGAGTTSSATAPPGGTLPPGQAVLGFSDFPPAATASWIVVRAGTAMAVPVTASLAGATSASLLSFNLYVRHPNKLAVPGPFYIALYASDGGGNPIGAPLGQVSPASFPWGNVVSYAFNFTLQTFAPSAAVNIVPGAKYWLAVASSATDLNIYSDTSATGTTPMKLALSGGTLPTLAAGSSFWLNPSNGFTANTNMFIIVQSNAAALASVLTITTMSSAGTSTGPAPAAATTGPTTGPTTNGATLVGPTTGAATVATVATVAGPTTGGAATVAGTTAGTGGTLPPVTAAGTPIPTSTTGSTGSQTFTYGWVHTIGSVITFAPAPNGVAVNVTIPPQLGVAAYNFVGWEVEIQHPLRQDVTGSFSFALYDNDPTTGRPVGAPLATASSSVFAWSAQATWPTSQNATNQIVNAAQPKALLPTRTYWVYLGSSVPINVFAACPGDQQMFVAAPPAPNPAIASSFILFNRCNMALKIRVTTVVGPTSLTTGPPAGVTATTGSSTAASALAATSSTAATSAAVVAATSAATVASTSAVASLTSTASATGNTLPPTASSVAAVAATSAAAAAAATVSSVATSAAATAATSGASVTTGGPLPSGDASVGFSDPPTGTSIAWITIIKGQSLAIPVDLTLPGATTAVLKSFNAYVRHANQQAITGPFYFGLYASGTDGKPIGTPLGAVTVASFPFSGVVSAGANVTLQSFAAAAGANLTPGNKYWIAVAVDPTASASLNIISDINGPTLFLLAMTGGPLPNVAAGSNFWLSPSGFNTADTRMFITVGTDAVSLATGPTVSTFGSLASTTSTAAAAGAGGATTAAGPTTGQGVTVTSNGAGPTTNGGATITSGATNGGSSTTATTAASTTNAIAASTSTVSNSLTSATTTSVASTVTAAAASTSTTASTTAVTSTAFASGGATGTTTAASTTSTVATTTSTVAATTSASTSTTAATDAATTTSFSSTTAAAGNSNSGGSGKHRKGLPGWAVALIVIAVIIAVIIIVLLIVLIIVKGSSSGGYVDMDKQQSKKNAKEDYNIRV